MVLNINRLPDVIRGVFTKKPKTDDRVDKLMNVERLYRAKADYSDTVMNYRNQSQGYTLIYPTIYDGENNLGELGNAQRLVLDFQVLSIRSWELFLKSDIAHTIISRKCKWVCSDGLKLKVEPDVNLFKQLGIKIDVETHNATIEALWKNYSTSFICDYNGKRTLDQLEAESYKNRVVGGDVLCIIRLIKGVPKVQLIDGTHVMTPLSFMLKKTDPEVVDNVIGFDRINPDNGNRVRLGVEIDNNGMPIAYFVRTGLTSNEYVRVERFNKAFGTIQAELLIGLEYRLDNNRGLPEVTPNMENLKLLSDYKHARVTGAVERAKVVFTIEHELGAGDENPYTQQQVSKLPNFKGDLLSPSNDTGHVIEGKEIANNFAARTSKEIVNLPQGSKFGYYEGKQETTFKEFYDTNLLSICATFGIPIEVALMKYEGSFSSSRAGLKDWEHTLKVDRKKCSSFKQMVFNYWLDVMVLQDKIDLPEYMDALFNEDWQVLSAYRNCEWVGSNVPHIDPEKEVRAERAKLGALGINAPLTTIEASTLALNGGNSVANISQFANELKECEKVGIPTPQPQETVKSNEVL
mgnify:CR=1 FL=1